MKALLFSVVFATSLANPDHMFAAKMPEIKAKAAIVMELETKKIIYQKNAYTPYHPASITKLPVALYALKKGTHSLSSIAVADQDTVGSITKKYSIEKKYKYPSHWLVLGGTHMEIHVGEQLRFEDLMYGMLLESANDASNVIAKHVSGSVPNFLNEMNHYLKKIGCKSTHFKNPHGLYYPEHMTTAYDMALIACEVAKEPTLIEILKTYKHKIPATNKKGERALKNHNKMVSKKSVYYYPHLLFGKNGYNDNAKNTYVAAAKKGQKTLVIVLMDCPSRNQKYEDALKLFKHGFKSL